MATDIGTYTGLYRAKAIKLTGQTLTAFIPQVFGETAISVVNFVGSKPKPPEMGWVSFHSGNPETPVWFGSGTPGPQGEPGTPGISGGDFYYRHQTATSPPPSSGYIRYNNVNVGLATTIWMHYVTGRDTDIHQVFRLTVSV